MCLVLLIMFSNMLLIFKIFYKCSKTSFLYHNNMTNPLTFYNIKPNCFYLLNKAWSKFGFFLSRIFNTVFIFLCYILIILPTSLFMRLFFNYDSMNLKKKTSLWFHLNNDSDTDNLKDQF